MDSVKLFFLNVFIYVLFLETYVLAFLLQRRFGVELPFLALFVSGVYTFIAITIWINVAHVWYTKIRSERRMLIRALCSELPFGILLAIFLLLWNSTTRAGSVSSDLAIFLILFGGYLFLFPAIMLTAKSHREKLADL